MILTGIEGQVYGMPFWDLLVKRLALHQEYRNMLFLEPFFCYVRLDLLNMIECKKIQN